MVTGILSNNLNLKNMNNQILNMTHQELMIASADVKLQYKEAKKLDLFNAVRVVIENGYNHIQFYNGCIKVNRNDSGIYYTIKNGRGTGGDCNKSSDLKYITDVVNNCGWGSIQSYK